MEPKKNPKAEIGRWSSIFLLAGLAFMLLVSWQVIEFKTYEKDAIADRLDVGDDLEEEVPVTQLNTPPPPPPPPPPPAPEVIEVIEDEKEIEETIIKSTETDQEEEIVEIEDIEEEEEEIGDVPFAVIENVPIYPGCEKKKSNAEKKKCMSDKVDKYIRKKFNADLATDLGLESGRQKINVQFKIDKNGNIANVRARASHPRLEQEAVRVVKSLPKMTPGKQRGKPVGVLYALPIVFQVEN